MLEAGFAGAFLGGLLDRPVKIAFYNWVSGLLIGLMPLLAHLLVYAASKPVSDLNANWAPDLVFISISNSGTAALSVFLKMLGGDSTAHGFPPLTRIVWVLLLLCFAFSSMLYGIDVTGSDNGTSWKIAIGLMVLSGICSLRFELATC
jgi:hypothetical protein